MEALTIRRATASDLEAIVALLADDVLGRARENPGPPLDPCYADAFAAIERDPNQFLAVAEEGGAIVACLQLSFIPGLSRRGLWRGQIESVRVAATRRGGGLGRRRSEEHTSELQSLMRISYAVFCLKKKNTNERQNNTKQ